MTGKLLLEIGTEEIPAGFLPGALEALKLALSKKFAEYRLNFGDVRVMGTPRRLAALVDSLALKQEDEEKLVFGPPKQAAVDAYGNFTPAALGFARAHGVDVTMLTVEQTAKGESICVHKKIQGHPTREILSEFLPSLIVTLPFPKSMRWGASRVSFARPIHWILALLDGEVVPFEVDGIRSSAQTRGHRFLAPEPFTVAGQVGYVKKLLEAQVIVDPDARTNKLRAEVNSAAAAAKGYIFEDEELVQINTFLVEYPSAVCGKFEEKFLQLPREVLITAMREHQKYFAVIDDHGQLLPHFVAVNNTLARNPDVVCKGHERVLRARLEDARFFFNEDRKRPFSYMAEALKGVLFQTKLGTIYQKMERFRELASFMAQRVRPDLVELVRRCAYFCKADLVSEMVQEFPALQGVMGRVYALHSGENETVSRAITEHYLPRFSGDALPQEDIGALVGMADRLDTIVGCFGIGLVPTGAADPYALRRHTLAIIHILLEKEYDLDLEELILHNLKLLKGCTERPDETVAEEVLNFFRARLQRLLSDRGYSHDILEAVLSVYLANIPNAFRRVEALEAWRKRPEFGVLATSFKRIMNIIKDQPISGNVDQSLFQTIEEKALFEQYQVAAQNVESELDRHNYQGMLSEIFSLKDRIHAFFDAVMVMDKDERIRRNRLNLLHELTETFMKMADFSKLEGKT
jgi:glycyl-tRNA synthetase beta chain